MEIKKRFWQILIGVIGLSLFFIIPISLIETGGEKPHNTETNHNETDKKFNATALIFDHIGDSYSWHLFTKNGKHVAVPLPVIVYSNNTGLNIFISSKLEHGHHYKDFYIAEDGEYKGKIVESSNNSHDNHEVTDEITEQESHSEASVTRPLDFSITKNVFEMFLSAFLLLWIFISIGRSYKKRGVTSAPKGLQGFIEPLIIFVRDEIARPNIGEHKYQKFMPYLLTVFFFIWMNNLMGLIPFFPFGSNVTGNIAVTLVLAMFTMLITNFNGNKNYWKHIFATPGVPIPLRIIMIPVELIGVISKPFALMIRLFANITAGHIIILSLVSMIFIFKSIYIAPVSIAMGLFMSMLELLVAALQAYVFTLLSALFIGLAIEEEHH